MDDDRSSDTGWSRPLELWRRVPTTKVVWLAIPLAGCSASPSILDPVSRDAGTISRLWWVMLGIAGVVFAFLMALLIGSVVRSRRDVDPSETPGRFGTRLVMWAGLIGPAVILAAVFTLSAFDLNSLARADEADMEIRVTGEQWWWRVEYPDQGAVTANEIHVPVGTDIRFVLDSGDVIHSFWAPRAGPKRDMVPGRVNDLVLSFDEPGTYRGFCSEFCGLQHANMRFFIVAEEADEFEAWVADQAADAVPPQSEVATGREVFLSSPCVGCHTIRGVSESGVRGPDLTHLAARETIAAGAVELDHDNLRAFVEDPARLKPGVLMPSSGLSDDDLDALVAYLETLR